MTTRETVVLLHGLGRTRFSMQLTGNRLTQAGFGVLNIGYPSNRLPIEALAEHVGRVLADRLPAETPRVHFLTHSMGGIVLRVLLASDRPRNLGRVVMLSPPNQGSQLAGRLRRRRLFQLFTGPSGQQLAAGKDSLPGALPAVDFELGILTGEASRTAFGHLIDSASDGKVSIDEAKVAGMTDFLVVRRGHTFIMNDPRVIDQAIRFFRRGRFAPPEEEG